MRYGLIVGLLLACPLAQAETTITLYSEAGQKPMSYEENGVAKGAYIDQIRRITQQIPGYKVQIKFASWARVVEEARTGNSAGIIGVYYRPQERPFLNHSKPIYREDVAVHCNRDAVAKRTFNKYPDDFAGLKFGNQRGYLAPGPEFFKFAQQGKIVVVEGLEFAGLVKKMLVGEIDCVVNPSLVLDEALNTLQERGLPERMRYKSERVMVIKSETVHVGFSKKYEETHPELAQFRVLFDKAAGS
ncbi:substrate-binding periplasmic protein [Silvimonas soli]|uniref:substrate-binding periplasmic protein n=1 Tax=Silvimonas soli TaxID=2980100 RepID=UPI0024B3BF31|nr:transporter substrate-binding domain-containing protein [Silvimonas soli]